MRIVKKIFKTLGILLSVVVLFVIVYVAYVFIQYYRIEDNQVLEIENNQTSEFNKNDTLTLSSYNIGFGAYSQEYSFFLDEGERKDGTKTKGIYSKALSKEDTIKNMNGIIDTIKELNVDFMFFQEVDVKANRSYFVNEYEQIKDTFNNYTSIYACNLHTAYLLYPLNDFMGKAEAGIVTLSKYKVDSSIRKQFPLSDSKFDNLFDLDRAFSVTRIKVDSKDLVLINIHMSAYDEGGIVRAKQLVVLNQILEEEKDNYVIVGGDFNHLLNDVKFDTELKDADWAAPFDFASLNPNYKVYAGSNAPTCRSSDIPYEKGVNNFVIIDGFICNNNIEVIKTEVIDTEFKYSDHNPTVLTFKLKQEIV